MITKIYIGQYIDPNSDTEASPMLDTREMKRIRDTFDCADQKYGKLGNIVEINDGTTCASLVEPLTFLVTSTDISTGKTSVDTIATMVNDSRETHDKIMFIPARADEGVSVMERMEEFKKDMHEEDKKKSKISTRNAILIGIGLTFFGVFVSGLFDFIPFLNPLNTL